MKRKIPVRFKQNVLLDQRGTHYQTNLHLQLYVKTVVHVFVTNIHKFEYDKNIPSASNFALRHKIYTS